MRRTWISVLALSAPLLIIGIESAQAWDWDRRHQRSARVYGYGPSYTYGPVYGYKGYSPVYGFAPNYAATRTAPITGYGPGYASEFGAGYYSPSVKMGPASWWREPRRRR